MRRGCDFGRQYGLSVLTGFGPKVSRSGTCFGIAAESGICGNGLQESQRWNRGPALGSCEGEIVKSDKSPSQIRNPKFRIGRKVVQLQISDLGFKMQDSSDFKFPLMPSAS